MKKGTAEIRMVDNIFIFIGENPGSNSSHIAGNFGFSGDGAKAIGKYVRRLLKKGLVKADVNLNYSLTKRGEKAFEKLKKEIGL